MDLRGDVLMRIRDMIPRMSKSQKKIAFYIQNEYETAVFMTAAELGKETGVSESTIVRFASALGYEGYPASACVSVDDVVVHGIPSKKTYIEEGQIVGVDLCAYVNGYHGDGARTFMIGKVSHEKKDLVETAEKAFFKGIEGISASSRLGDISGAIQEYVESRGYSVVRALTGHGIGREMHEDPSVPNYGVKGRGLRLHSGMTLAVEPMINLGRFDVYTERDGWTVRTKDRSPSAHYENTVVIWEDGVEILTL